MEIGIWNLSANTKREWFYEVFQRYGEISKLYMVMDKIDKKTGQRLPKPIFRGYAFIEFKSKEAAREAVEKENQKRVGRRIIKVGFATTRPCGRRKY